MEQLRYFKIVIFETVSDTIVKEIEPVPQYLADKMIGEFTDTTFYIEKQEV